MADEINFPVYGMPNAPVLEHALTSFRPQLTLPQFGAEQPVRHMLVDFYTSNGIPHERAVEYADRYIWALVTEIQRRHAPFALDCYPNHPPK